MTDEELLQRLEETPPDQWSPEAARAYVRSELEYWTKVIREYNIQGE